MITYYAHSLCKHPAAFITPRHTETHSDILDILMALRLVISPLAGVVGALSSPQLSIIKWKMLTNCLRPSSPHTADNSNGRNDKRSALTDLSWCFTAER